MKRGLALALSILLLGSVAANACLLSISRRMNAAADILACMGSEMLGGVQRVITELTEAERQDWLDLDSLWRAAMYMDSVELLSRYGIMLAGIAPEIRRGSLDNLWPFLMKRQSDLMAQAKAIGRGEAPDTDLLEAQLQSLQAADFPIRINSQEDWAEVGRAVSDYRSRYLAYLRAVAEPPLSRLLVSITSPSQQAVANVEVDPDLDEGDIVLRVQGFSPKVHCAPWSKSIEDLLPQWIDETRFIFSRSLIVDTVSGHSTPIRVSGSEQTLSSSLSTDREALALSVADGDTGTFQVWLVHLGDMSKELIFEYEDTSPYTGLERTVRWGADGSLYFVVVRSESSTSVFRWREEEGCSMAFGNAAYPSHSPDGKYIAYRETDSDGRLHDWIVVTPETGARTANPHDGVFQWLPQPGRYAIYSGNEITVYAVDSNEPMFWIVKLPGPVGVIMGDDASVSVRCIVIDAEKVGSEVRGVQDVSIIR